MSESSGTYKPFYFTHLISYLTSQSQEQKKNEMPIIFDHLPFGYHSTKVVETNSEISTTFPRLGVKVSVFVYVCEGILLIIFLASFETVKILSFFQLQQRQP